MEYIAFEYKYYTLPHVAIRKNEIYVWELAKPNENQPTESGLRTPGV